MRLLHVLEKKKETWILLLLSGFFFLLRFPSFIEPNWYGDEGIYQAIGRSLNQGHILYSQIWDNKPPLLYLIYAVFDANQFLIRFFSACIGILTTVFFFLTAKMLLHTNKGAIIASILFIFLFGSPVIEGNIANAENFMLLPMILAFYFWIRNKSQLEKHITSRSSFRELFHFSSFPQKVYGGIGLIIGISFTIKTVALFDALAILCCTVFLFYNQTSRRIRTTNIYSVCLVAVPFMVGFILPMLLFFFFSLISGSAKDFISAVFLGNIGYVGYENTFIIPQGLLILRTIMLVVILFILFIKRKVIPIDVQIILIWLSFSVYNTFFSNRPYPHYFLLLIPPLCLYLAYIFIHKKIIQAVVVILVLSFTISVFNISYAKNPLTYYANFTSYLFNLKSTNEYHMYFDKNVLRDYAIATYIKERTQKDDRIFIWGNSPQIYVLSHTIPPIKYTVAYHIAYNDSAIQEVSTMLEEKKPRLLILLPDEKKIPFSLSNYQYLVTIEDTQIYERIN